MKVLILKNNQSRFTIDYKLIQDDEKFNQNEYVLYGTDAKKCCFSNAIFENNRFEYEPYSRNGIVFTFKDNNTKQIFEIDNGKIINRIPFDSTLDVDNDHLIVRAVFAYDENTKDVDVVKRKFETNLKCQIIDKLQKQLQSIMKIKSQIEF